MKANRPIMCVKQKSDNVLGKIPLIINTWRKRAIFSPLSLLPPTFYSTLVEASRYRDAEYSIEESSTNVLSQSTQVGRYSTSTVGGPKKGLN